MADTSDKTSEEKFKRDRSEDSAQEKFIEILVGYIGVTAQELYCQKKMPNLSLDLTLRSLLGGS